jgi:hypothetical protein
MATRWRAVLVLIGLSGCGTVPSIQSMQTDPRCRAWASGAFGHVATGVEKERSTIYGRWGEVEGAYFKSPTEIEFPGRWGRKHLGTLSGGSVTLHGNFADVGPVVIGRGRAEIPAAFGSVVVEFNDRCSERDAALGIVNIFVLASEKRY